VIESVLYEAAKSVGFHEQKKTERYTFFEKNDHGSVRYLVFAFLAEGSLPSIDDIHDDVLTETPEEMATQTGFNKNCDLILIQKVSNYQAVEQDILLYEEDPYYFKKYFLHFTDDEEAELKGKTFADLKAVISDSASFSRYKQDPSAPSFYCLAARIFIKVPFLEVPRAEKELVPLSVEISNALTEDMRKTWEILPQYPASEPVDKFVEKMINDELEILENSNSGV
jgi:hypothetical protein